MERRTAVQEDEDTHSFCSVSNELVDSIISHVSSEVARYQLLHLGGCHGCVRCGGKFDSAVVGVTVQLVMGQLLVYCPVLGGTLLETGPLPLLVLLVLLLVLVLLVLAAEELDGEGIVVGLLGSMPTQYELLTQKLVPQSSFTSGFQA